VVPGTPEMVEIEESHEIMSRSWAASSATSAGRAVLPTRKQGISWRGEREERWIGPEGRS